MKKPPRLLECLFFRLFWRLLPHKTDLLFGVGLAQDASTLHPLIEEASRRSLSFRITVIGEWGLQCLPQQLIDHKSKIISLKDAGRWSLWRLLFRIRPKALICGAESSVRPHGYLHRLTYLANVLNIKTYTLQHGFENVGINYVDDLFGPDVKIASRTIFTWNSPSSLPSFISQEIRSRCIGIGRAALESRSPERPSFLQDKILVSVFENLHWKRYTDEYRMRFCDDLAKIVTLFPHLTFILKPHIASDWILKNRHDFFTQFNNLAVTDSKMEKWRNISVDQLLTHSIAAITTPSTIALDAALLSKPVAIAAYKLQLSVYEPLPQLNSLDDWEAFLTNATDKPDMFVDMAKEFCKRSALPGNSTAAIIDYVTEHNSLSH